VEVNHFRPNSHLDEIMSNLSRACLSIGFSFISTKLTNSSPSQSSHAGLSAKNSVKLVYKHAYKVLLKTTRTAYHTRALTNQNVGSICLFARHQTNKKTFDRNPAD
jgi:hypothetical protein